MEANEQALVAELLQGQRWAALGTLRQGAPFASWVAFAAEAEGSLLLHLSRLAPHTQNLLADPRASLAISAPAEGVEDPQTLARISIQGHVVVLDGDDPEYAAAKARYLAALPSAAMLFSFPDFLLLRLVPIEARYIGGFARAFNLSAQELRAALASKAT